MFKAAGRRSCGAPASQRLDRVAQVVLPVLVSLSEQFGGKGERIRVCECASEVEPSGHGGGGSKTQPALPSSAAIQPSLCNAHLDVVP